MMENAVWDVSYWGRLAPDIVPFIGLFMTVVAAVGFNFFSERKSLFIASWAPLMAGASCFLASIFLW